MIRSFRHKGLKRFFDDDDRSKLRQDLITRIAEILAVIDATETVEQIGRPSFRLHALKGDLKGFWAVTVRANWRIVFRFANGDAFDVDLTDYH
jgi:toxin HigB-1